MIKVKFPKEQVAIFNSMGTKVNTGDAQLATETLTMANIIESDSFKHEILEAIERGKGEDWVYDGEDEHCVETFDPDDSLSEVIMVLKKYLSGIVPPNYADSVSSPAVGSCRRLSHDERTWNMQQWLFSHGAMFVGHKVFDNRGVITKIDWGNPDYLITIQPVELSHNLGNGCGCSVTIRF